MPRIYRWDKEVHTTTKTIESMTALIPVPDEIAEEDVEEYLLQLEEDEEITWQAGGTAQDSSSNEYHEEPYLDHEESVWQK